MNAGTVAFVYHRTHQEWKTLEEAMLIIDDPAAKELIAKEIDKRRQNANKIREMLEKFEVDAEDGQS